MLNKLLKSASYKYIPFLLSYVLSFHSSINNCPFCFFHCVSVFWFSKGVPYPVFVIYRDWACLFFVLSLMTPAQLTCEPRLFWLDSNLAEIVIKVSEWMQDIELAPLCCCCWKLREGPCSAICHSREKLPLRNSNGYPIVPISSSFSFLYGNVGFTQFQSLTFSFLGLCRAFFQTYLSLLSRHILNWIIPFYLLLPMCPSNAAVL